MMSAHSHSAFALLPAEHAFSNQALQAPSWFESPQPGNALVNTATAAAPAATGDGGGGAVATAAAAGLLATPPACTAHHVG